MPALQVNEIKFLLLARLPNILFTWRRCLILDFETLVTLKWYHLLQISMMLENFFFPLSKHLPHPLHSSKILVSSFRQVCYSSGGFKFLKY